MSQPDSVEQLTTEMREWGSLPAKWEWPVRIELLFAAERERSNEEIAKLEIDLDEADKDLRRERERYAKLEATLDRAEDLLRAVREGGK